MSSTLTDGLVALPCALCSLPVCHYDPTVIGSRVGGLCSRTSCRTDSRNGTRRQVYTFAIVVGWPDYAKTDLESSGETKTPKNPSSAHSGASALH